MAILCSLVSSLSCCEVVSCLLSSRGKRGGAIVGLIIRRRHESGEGLIFLIAPICTVEEISIVSFISFIFSLERKKMSWMGQMWRCEAEGWGLAWPGLAWARPL